jgi:hypothetical protein
MAEQIPLNRFLTEPIKLTTIDSLLYTTPLERASILLGSQASNYSSSPVTITFIVSKNGQDYVMLNEYTIPPGDQLNVVNGKLILDYGCAIRASVSVDDSVSIVLSILETTI